VKPAIERVLGRIVRLPFSGCWIFTGATNNFGYGIVGLGSRGQPNDRAHRITYRHFRGEIPDGMFVCHTCDVPSCCNPDHLFLGDRADNMKDAAKKRRICTIGKSNLTHCVNGHEFTEENTRRDKHGHRRCRICAKEASIRNWEKNRAKYNERRRSA